MHKDENGNMKYDAQDFAALTLGEDIIEITGETHRAEDGRTLHHIRGESGAIYYCEAEDLDDVRENAKVTMRNQPPSRFETAITLVISLALTAIGLAVWNQQFTKAIPLAAAVLLTLFVYIKFWTLHKSIN
jgi:hypothetical protein